MMIMCGGVVVVVVITFITMTMTESLNDEN
jgi:hypothetical protein